MWNKIATEVRETIFNGNAQSIARKMETPRSCCAQQRLLCCSEGQECAKRIKEGYIREQEYSVAPLMQAMQQLVEKRQLARCGCAKLGGGEDTRTNEQS